MITTIIIIGIYIISVLRVRNWMRKAHSKNGRWDNQNTDNGALFFTLFPILNTFVSLILIFKSPYKEDSTNYNRFFGVKN